MTTDDRIEQARLRYERAVFGGEASVLAIAERDLDGVEADLALARGRLIHARFLAHRKEQPEQLAEDPREVASFARAAQLYQQLGDVRGEAESLFWVGCFHQVVRGDSDTAVPVLQRSAELAAQAGDELTLSYALRHLGIAEHAAGRLDSARAHLEESVRLRREAGFMPGVAANLVGLAHIAAEEDRRDEALALLAEAGALARASGADGIMSQVEQARAQL